MFDSFLRAAVVACLLGASVVELRAQSDQVVYDEQLLNGWENWSWATVSLSATSPVHGGTKSISVSAGAWQAFYLHHPAFDSTPFTNITFWIHGGPIGGQRLQLQGLLSGTAQTAFNLGPLPANSWQSVTCSLATLGVAGRPNLDGFWIQDRTGASQPTFYVDDIRLIAGTNGPPAAGTNAVVTVDAAANRRAIRAEIYGVAFASPSELQQLNVPLNRSGGNATSRYNWQANATSRAADWYFESLPSASATAGADGDAFIDYSLQGGAEPMLTIPINGWVAKLGPGRGRLASYSIAKYGAQTGNDSQWFPDAGNGISQASGRSITNNNPNDANQAANASFQAGWVRHLTNRWGTASNGGLRYYVMDNEWSIWHETHRDVHLTGATMDQVRDAFLAHATMIKDIDPGALILGPEEWGWSGYLYSGYDLQWGSLNGWGNLPDRAAHGGRDFVPWFVDQIRQRSTTAGRRLLDVLTLHYYPQGGEFSSAVDNTMQLRRNRSTRSLWDPNYVDETWINDRVQLIPRLRNWAEQNYPGTPIGITEYNWGAEDHINGATTQADILGIFGREGLDLATRWVVPGSTTPTFKAIRMYRNYDGNRSTFGETSVAAAAPDPDRLSTFAALRSGDGALTVMVVNKVPGSPSPVTLRLTNFVAGSAAQVWQLTSANTITRLADLSVSGTTLSNTVPAQSITLFVVPAAVTAPRLRLITPLQAGQVELWLDGQAGGRYVLQSSTNLSNWSPLQTNTAASNSLQYLLPRQASGNRFYRALVQTP